MNVIQITNRSRHRGFTFTEILFAVMILGIGFIMVAAMFPVAIQQTQSTAEETVASAIAREGAAYVARIATDATMPPTFRTGGTYFPVTSAMLTGALADQTWIIPGDVWSFRDPRLSLRTFNLTTSPPRQFQASMTWSAVNHNLILPSDPSYAWFPMYKRDRSAHFDIAHNTPVFENAPYAQVIIIGVQVRNSSAYRAADIQGNPANPNVGTFEPEPAVASISAATAAEASLITFQASSNAVVHNRLVEGAFVVISNDNQSPPLPGNFNIHAAPTIVQYRSLNGTVFRLGRLRPDRPANTYELQPGQDLRSGLAPADKIPKANVLVIGRGYKDPTKPTSGFDGPAQDVAVYTTIVQVN